MKWLKKNEAVYVAKDSIVKIDSTDIALLKNNVASTPDKRIRICAHTTSNDYLHEMLIVLHRDTYIRPHKHTSKCESFHVIDGLLDVIIFDDVGNITEIIRMGDPQSGRHFYYRLSAPYFHTLYIHSETVVFHETTNGPFKEGETVYAPWSPEKANDCDWQSYQHSLLRSINQFIGETCKNMS